MSDSTTGLAKPSTSLELSLDILQSAPFRSILPILDDILQTLHAQSTSLTPPNAINASAQVAEKARELASALEEMRRAAMNLPGGDMSLEAIRRMNDLLDEEAEKRRDILRTFGNGDMPLVEEIMRGRTGEESTMPTPSHATS